MSNIISILRDKFVGEIPNEDIIFMIEIYKYENIKQTRRKIEKIRKKNMIIQQ